MFRLRPALLAVVLVFALVFSAFGGILPAKAGELVDVGFEGGNLDGWIVLSSPDAVSVSAADAYTQPYWGDYMAVLGTPVLFDVSQPLGPNSIAKTFTVLTPTIAFAYNMFTMDYALFDEFSYVVTLSSQGAVIAQFSMDAFGSNPPAGYAVSTGWREVNLDLSLYAGQQITIQIAAGGTKDNAHPTWAYFDMRLMVLPIGDMMGPVIRLPGLETSAGIPVAGSSSSRRYSLVTDVYDDSGWATVGIVQNGVTVTGGSGVGWQTYDLALTEGPNDVILVASDAFGNTTSRKLTVFVDSRPPEVTLEAVPRSTANASLVISGTVLDARSGVASLTIDGTEVAVGADGAFASRVPLVVGSNTNTVTARDSRGNAVSWDIMTTRIRAGSTRYIAMSGTLTVGSTLGMLEGVSFPLDAVPFIKDGRTLLPIRALIEALGGSVRWNATRKTATVMLGSQTVALTIGSKTALVNGKPVALDVAPMIVKGRTFLPLRAVAENVSLDLGWEPVSQTISFTYWP